MNFAPKGLGVCWHEGMNLRIPVYSPNISTQRLIDLLSATLNQERTIVDFERLDSGVKFRAPDLVIVLHPDVSDMEPGALLVNVVQRLIEAARLLGATQFSLEHDGFDMRLRPTDIGAQHIEHLIIASSSFKLDQINIF